MLTQYGVLLALASPVGIILRPRKSIDPDLRHRNGFLGRPSGTWCSEPVRLLVLIYAMARDSPCLFAEWLRDAGSVTGLDRMIELTGTGT